MTRRYPNAREVEEVREVLMPHPQSLRMISAQSGVDKDRARIALHALRWQKKAKRTSKRKSNGRIVVTWEGRR